MFWQEETFVLVLEKIKHSHCALETNYRLNLRDFIRSFFEVDKMSFYDKPWI